MPIITVSGTLGSGAREIAQAAARELGLDYVDQEILVEAARRLGVSVADVESRDEPATGLGERLASIMRTLMERSAVAGASDPMSGGGLEMILGRTYGEAADLPSEAERGQPDDERYLKTLTSVIRGIAARGKVVILGRGSQAILQHEPEALHVYVGAPTEQRIATLVQQEGMEPQDAERRLKQSDQNRQAFHRRYFKIDADTPKLYDLMLRSDRIQPDLAVKLIALAVRDRTPRPG
ncbi:MAG: cytidylate kinase-like family protein [Dehalococcoidia bacterium]